MKKKIAVFALLLAGSLMFAITASAGPVLDNILKKGELRIGTSGQQPPMTAINKKGEIIGLDADIAKAMAAAMDVKVKFVVMPFNKLLPALEAGRVDMVISGMTMTAKRNMKVAFAGPYYVSGKGILATAEKYAALKEAKGLNTPEVTIAALKDSTSQKYAETLMPKAKLILTQSYDEAIALLFKTKIDVLVADYPFCALSAYRHQDLLINWVQNFLVFLQGTGELKKMHSQWLSGGAWIDELP
ncbi:MAG: transporter substrate-binding domain-containing protein [Desulfosarcina sp.]|nr:transporter substrate-binding domain-containing protein [Desulfosarcina sp.]